MTGTYSPIRDYAVIGDCHGCALVGLDGSIDWCALRRFDADPVACRLLDADQGGFWSIRPLGHWTSTREYLTDTNVLVTSFSTATGSMRVTDFMPVGRRLDASAHDYVSLNVPNWVVRRIEGLAGTVEVEVRYRPSRDYARAPVSLARVDGAIVADGLPSLHSSLAFTLDGDLATALLRLDEGDSHDLVLAGNTVSGAAPGERVGEFLAITTAFWQEWIAYCRYAGPYADAVRRSALVLKAMTYAPTGALVAALTTSPRCDPRTPTLGVRGTMMDAGDLREVFETILPEEALMTAVPAAGLPPRERKLDALRLLRAMAISAAYPATALARPT